MKPFAKPVCRSNPGDASLDREDATAQHGAYRGANL